MCGVRVLCPSVPPLAFLFHGLLFLYITYLDGGQHIVGCDGLSLVLSCKVVSTRSQINDKDPYHDEYVRAGREVMVLERGRDECE